MLNDPHFGDVMMWHLDQCPRLFVDSRYDIYPEQVMKDYWRMVKAQPHAYELLCRYDIRWIMLPPDLDLPRNLLSDPRWKKIYGDEDAVVLRKSAGY